MCLLANSEQPLYPLGLRHALTNELQVEVICPEKEKRAQKQVYLNSEKQNNKKIQINVFKKKSYTFDLHFNE